MTTRDVHSRRQERVGEVQAGRREAGVVGALAGAVVSGLAMKAVAPAYLVMVGTLLGVGSASGALVVWLLLSLLLGAGFAVVARGRVSDGDPVADAVKLGLGYGALAAVVGVVLVPAMVGAATRFRPDVPLVNAPVVLAYGLFGLAAGTGYAASLQGLVPSFGVGGGRTQATVVGSLAGGVASGVVLWAAAPVALARLAASFGMGASISPGFVLWLVLALAFGAIYSRTSARTVERGEGERVGLARAGVLHGVVLAVVAGMFVVPATTAALSEFSPSVPLVDPGVLAAYLVYGGVLGIGYGAVLDGGRVFPEELGEGSAPAVVGAVTGAVVGGVFLAGAVGVKYFVYIAVAFHLGATESVAWATWFVVAGLLAYGFARTVAPERDAEGVLEVSVKRGALYGAVAGGIIVALLPPLVASTDYTFGMSAQGPLIFLGYVVFGAAVGAGYGASIDGLESPTFGTERQRAVVFGSLFGGFAGGFVIHQLAGRVWIQYVGAIVRVPGSIPLSWLAWLALCLGMGLVFQRYVDANVDAYVNALMARTAENDALRRYAQPFVEHAALTSTTAGMGVLYGVAVAVVVGMLALPIAVVTASDFVVQIPATDPFLFVGYVVYGLFLGVGYGTILEF